MTRLRPGIALAILSVVLASTALADVAPRLALRPSRPSSIVVPHNAHVRPADLVPGTRLAGAPADTARMLVLLVEFPEDDDPTTTGTGRFEVEPDDTYSINQPPHDQGYFDRQLQALRNYIEPASSGRLHLEWTIFPSSGAPDPYLEMPEEMRFYNPDTTDAALNERLAAFLVDAVEVGDAAGAPFAGIDHLVIFHAGVGQDLLINEETPSDIPSAFLSFEELREYLGEDESFEGIPVEGGTAFVREGLWLPETENQEGFEFGLTGVFAQLFGSALGLPILWNPDSGAPGIGRFGLMDQGGGNESGLVPAFPCAWSRFFLGWDTAGVINATERAPASYLPAGQGPFGIGSELGLLPVDDREFFLVEFRKKDVDGDGQLTTLSDQSVVVEVVSDEYDFGVPGTGLLVWHIDQAVIDATYDDNRVNADFRHRGVKLVEADGLDEIGLYPEGGFGLPDDAFHLGANATFGPFTAPSSVSNYGDAYTGVHVEVRLDTTKTLLGIDAWRDAEVSWWPRRIPGTLQALPPIAADLNGRNDVELVVAASDHLRIYEGTGRFALQDSLPMDGARDLRAGELSLRSCDDCAEVAVVDGVGDLHVLGWTDDGAFWADSLATLGSVPGTDLREVRLADLLGNGRRQVLSVGGMGWGFHWFDDGDTLRTAMVPAPTGDMVAYALPVQGAFSGLIDILVITDAGRVLGYDAVSVMASRRGDVVPTFEAELGGSPASRPVVGDLDRDGIAELIVRTADERIRAVRLIGVTAGGPQSLQPLDGWPVSVSELAGPLALGDLDGDGRPEVIFGDGDLVRALNVAGVRAEGWPVALQSFAGGDDGPPDPMAVRAEPLVADLDADGRQDVVLASPDGLLRAWSGNGIPLERWPRPAGRTHATTPVISTFDGGTVLATNPDAGWFHAARIFDADLDALAAAHWPAAGGGQDGAGVLPTDRLGAVTSPSSGATEGSLVVYPNPAHERVTFRFVSADAGEASLTVYDAAGSIVHDHRFGVVGGVTNEHPWDLRNDDGQDVAPGLYLVRMTVTGGGAAVGHETKLAVFR